MAHKAGRGIMEPPKGRLKVIMLCAALPLVAVSAFLFIYNFPKKIDLEYPALEYRVGKPESGEVTTIKVKGTIYKPLFRDPSFHGQFIINKYDYTKNYQLRDIDFYQDLLFYHQNENGTSVHKPLGYLMISDNFAQMNIYVNENMNDNQLIGKDLRISAPAKNYEEAMRINAELKAN
ncbi:hypothetical protein AB4Z45_29950 [Paenibacillus sp. MCAF9]|uniref:hypothetical protein n=1 Tax=Paenibacillus sp. MCAF9 TaxID=3233046 RepID=UPI003F9E4B86